MLLYDSLNLIISGVHQSHLGCWGHRSEKVKLRGLDYVAYKICQCAVLPGQNSPDKSRRQKVDGYASAMKVQFWTILFVTLTFEPMTFVACEL